ncbi:S-adenosyl-L-methionine-dependent tRNA 4-demethylwyosine synthase TYW1-like isoform X2 [Branchiostoma floridae]|uniref:S-adenosyl-L-methionine-dependent tRNA 4-demethylwyosine synthase TYW1 n=1 Tax=Branchiostoma floridae TaxID=7739 RepID=A0A9J7LX85_BRAFL|nr:S-adenosyl-L-methionine-dependent tRNA 4-demethylwyosine synthase TYW1-like isoform X2 [Branchiostoma floridae]
MAKGRRDTFLLVLLCGNVVMLLAGVVLAPETGAGDRKDLSSMLQWLWGLVLNMSSAVVLAMVVNLLLLLRFVYTRRKNKLKEQTVYVNKDVACYKTSSQDILPPHLRIFYGTQTGTAKHFAELLHTAAQDRGLTSGVKDLAKVTDPEDTFTEEMEAGSVCVFILSTYTDGQPPEGAAWVCRWLEESSTDFRVSKTLLGKLKYAVFGLGSSEYGDNFNMASRKLEQWLQTLGAQGVFPRGEGDQNVAGSRHGSLEQDFAVWRDELLGAVMSCESQQEGCCKQESTESCQCKGNDNRQGEDEEVQYESSSEDGSLSDDDDSLVDVEDLGAVMNKMKQAKQRQVEEEAARGGLRKITVKKKGGEPKEMITPALKKALEKQGYRLIGSHSGVKLCRWTKSMLRGRGGCYKHTFYGIESHRCMETTPSLACANKCVFCWRHHTNPVGTEWRWKMDDPQAILDGAMKNHYNLIKQFKGVPGVKPERLAEAMDVQHCALSLVGEPIMYPQINTFVQLLHSHRISSFLVTNAQFPDAIRNMDPVTQLYVSVDASTKDSLKKIDRPLFRDFWPRFLDSLKALSEKGQRTVYRLTLVKAWNVDEIENYAQLVEIGKPDFIEVKGVTYCGESKASNLSMANIPWHEEVVNFVQQLADQLPAYEIAAEHEHSNCVLLANTKFKKGSEWWTWIDYQKFHQLIADYTDSGGDKMFSAEDYMAKTPSWAVFGSREQGFDPQETRWYRKNRKDISGC